MVPDLSTCSVAQYASLIEGAQTNRVSGLRLGNAARPGANIQVADSLFIKVRAAEKADAGVPVAISSI